MIKTHISDKLLEAFKPICRRNIHRDAALGDLNIAGAKFLSHALKLPINYRQIMPLRAALEALIAPLTKVVAVINSAAVVDEDLVAVEIKLDLPDVIVIVAFAVVTRFYSDSRAICAARNVPLRIAKNVSMITAFTNHVINTPDEVAEDSDPAVAGVAVKARQGRPRQKFGLAEPRFYI